MISMFNTMMFLMCYIIDDMVLLLNIRDEVVILDEVMPSYYSLVYVAAIMLFIDYILMITRMTCKWCKWFMLIWF